MKNIFTSYVFVCILLLGFNGFSQGNLNQERVIVYNEDIKDFETLKIENPKANAENLRLNAINSDTVWQSTGNYCGCNRYANNNSSFTLYSFFIKQKNISEISKITANVTGTYSNVDISNIRLLKFNFSNNTFTTIATKSSNSVGYGEIIEFDFSPSYVSISDTNSVFYIIVKVAPNATLGKTININGSLNPVLISYQNNPIIIDNQSDLSGIIYINTPNLNTKSISVPLDTFYIGSDNNLVNRTYLISNLINAKVSKVNYKISGNYTSDDIASFKLLIKKRVSQSQTVTYSSELLSNSQGMGEILQFNIAFDNLSFINEYLDVSLVAKLTENATINRIINIDVLENPVQFELDTNIIIENNQTNLSNQKIIVQPKVSQKSIFTPSSNVFPNSKSVPIYAIKIKADLGSVYLKKIVFKTSGNYLGTDISNFKILFSNSEIITNSNGFPSYSLPSGYGDSIVFNFSYSNYPILQGDSLYVWLAADISSNPKINDSIYVNGLVNPVEISYYSNPEITNNQTHIGGVKKIAVPKVSYSTLPTTINGFKKGSLNNIITKFKIQSDSGGVTLKKLKFKLSGTFNQNDISKYRVVSHNYDDFYYYNNPVEGTVISGDTIEFILPENYYNNWIIPENHTRYIWLIADIAETAQSGNTIEANMVLNPVKIEFESSVIETNQLSNISITKTIENNTITQTTIALPANNVIVGTKNFPIYELYLNSTKGNNTLKTITFRTSGNYDSTDISSFSVYISNYNSFYNSSSMPEIKSKSAGQGETVTFDFSTFTRKVNENENMYIWLVANTANYGTAGKNIFVDGSINSANITYFQNPEITDTQSNLGGVQTLAIPKVTYTSVSTPFASIYKGSKNNLINRLAIEPNLGNPKIKKIKYYLSGNYNNSDMSNYKLYYTAYGNYVNFDNSIPISPSIIGNQIEFDLSNNEIILSQTIQISG